MKTPHTPGHWLKSKSGNTFQIVAGEDGNGEPNTLVATVHPIGYNCEYEPCEETKANARLIASAPELLETLGEIVAEYHALQRSQGASANIGSEFTAGEWVGSRLGGLIAKAEKLTEK